METLLENINVGDKLRRLRWTMDIRYVRHFRYSYTVHIEKEPYLQIEIVN